MNIIVITYDKNIKIISEERMKIRDLQKRVVCAKDVGSKINQSDKRRKGGRKNEWVKVMG